MARSTRCFTRAMPVEKNQWPQGTLWLLCCPGGEVSQHNRMNALCASGMVLIHVQGCQVNQWKGCMIRCLLFTQQCSAGNHAGKVEGIFHTRPVVLQLVCWALRPADSAGEAHANTAEHTHPHSLITRLACMHTSDSLLFVMCSNWVEAQETSAHTRAHAHT